MGKFSRLSLILSIFVLLIMGIISTKEAHTNDVIPRAYLPVVMYICDAFTDDFTDPSSGWPVIDDSQKIFQYLNDEYRVVSKLALNIYRPISPTPALENYVVEVDARWAGAPTNGLYGLVFGVNDDVSRYYIFGVFPDSQTYRLWRRESNGDVTPLIATTPSTAINTGTAVNHIAAVRQGNQITLLVNDTTLGTWVDGAITGFTRSGVAMSPNPSNPVADARFDNYRVHLCYSELGSASAPTGDAPSWQPTFVDDGVDSFDVWENDR